MVDVLMPDYQIMTLPIPGITSGNHQNQIPALGQCPPSTRHRHIVQTARQAGADPMPPFGLAEGGRSSRRWADSIPPQSPLPSWAQSRACR